MTEMALAAENEGEVEATETMTDAIALGWQETDMGQGQAAGVVPPQAGQMDDHFVHIRDHSRLWIDSKDRYNPRQETDHERPFLPHDQKTHRL